MGTLSSSKNPQDSESARSAAAVIIQRLWRSRHNRAKEEYLNPEARWQDAVTNAEFEVEREHGLEGRNSPERRWKRAIFLIRRMQDHDPVMKGEGVHMDSTQLESKTLEAQHWLELIDGKHRYGSNLKSYHQRWKEDDTVDNFFHWLDYGAGKDLSLDECPRERLESERIQYLSVEQRLNYLVKITDDGKLIWAKNSQPVDTTSGHWKDAGDGAGIVPRSLPTGVEKVPGQPALATAEDLDPKTQKAAGTHYTTGGVDRSSWSQALRRLFTPHGWVEHLLKKTVQRNTWMYISDRNFNLFVGIKETGNFQHSSFLAGGLVTSAGLIKVKNGIIYALSPLSGHYRTSVEHFHQFVKVLHERGVDMSRVHIGKEEAILRGVEHLGKFKKTQKSVVRTTKAKAKIIGTSLVPQTEWKREILEGRRQHAPTRAVRL